ncbi:34165_t:CDS:2, partial [Gigaspora margarita]
RDLNDQEDHEGDTYYEDEAIEIMKAAELGMHLRFIKLDIVVKRDSKLKR